MPLPPSHLDWSKRLQYDWTSQEGLDRLNGIVGPSITYKPRHFQLYDSACILNGTGVVCMTATGDGKSALILFPALARKEMINIVIEPTNSLESDMAFNLCTKEVTAVVINADTKKTLVSPLPRHKFNPQLWPPCPMMKFFHPCLGVYATGFETTGYQPIPTTILVSVHEADSEGET